MNKLQLEMRRLYVPPAPAGANTDAETPSLVDASGQVRAMVLELARPADWAALSKVWQGVQVDLALPAPAIAVSGKDGYQLWFSLAAPVPAAQAMAFLESLRVRYLGDIKADRVGSMLAVDAGRVPAVQADSGLWSAFVAPDLAPVFAEEPWLDMPPNSSGQADLLARLKSMQPADFQQALQQLQPGGMAVDARPASAAAQLEPKRFLLDLMNDDTVALALRIEAAKALLPYFNEQPRH